MSVDRSFGIFVLILCWVDVVKCPPLGCAVFSLAGCVYQGLSNGNNVVSYAFDTRAVLIMILLGGWSVCPGSKVKSRQARSSDCRRMWSFQSVVYDVDVPF